MRTNQFNQPIGENLTHYHLFKYPDARCIKGQYGQLVKLSIKHIDDLYNELCDTSSEANWTYLYDGPFYDKDSFTTYIEQLIDNKEKYFFVIQDIDTQKSLGLLALMRINPLHGTIEVGNVHYSNTLKHTRIATDIQYILAKYVFETLGYRRYEWKCDNLNLSSKHAAERLGFKFEGIFRQSNIYKGRNRDTAWFSMLDYEWPEIKERFVKWLAPSNFNEHQEQIRHLKDFS